MVEDINLQFEAQNVEEEVVQAVSKKPNKPQEVRSANKKPQSKPAKDDSEKYDDWGLSDKKEPAKP